MSIEIALRALEDDARLWAGASDELGKAATAVRGLHLDAAAFPRVDGLDLAAAYDVLVTRLEGLLANGSFATNSVSVALIATRQEFESADAAARDRVRKAWGPR